MIDLKQKWKKYAPIILTIFLLCGVMFYFNNKKQGFHEDEIFSYGSSNYRYDNVYRNYGYAQSNNDYLFHHVLTGNLWNRATGFIDFLIHQEDYQNEFDETLKKEIPIWKTKEDAKEYMTVSQSDILNFASVWYNQLCDVHPPMFYNFLHIFSIFFLGNFTKYIGFFLNLTFFILTLLSIYKIMKLLDKEKLRIPAMILYGASIGAISTVNFHRMYMMLTCFSTIYLYYALKFLKQDYKLNKKEKIFWSLNIFLGFMTQYYFCIYIIIIFLILSTMLWKQKKGKDWKTLLLIHAIPAILGILYFPASIEDIFFSYRGLGAAQDHSKTFLESFLYYMKGIQKSFSIPLLLIISSGLWILFKVYKVVKKEKKVSINSSFLLILIPIPLFLLIISKIAPFLGEEYTTRYMMLLFPSIAIIIILILDDLINNNKSIYILIIATLFLSCYGWKTETPTYLYEGYEDVMELAQHYKEKDLIYIYDNYFTHLNSMPEFMTYQKHLIINYQIYDFNLLKQDEELKKEQEVILCIKNWLNTEEILNKVLENTDFNNAEKLLEIKDDINSTYYKLTKSEKNATLG